MRNIFLGLPFNKSYEGIPYLLYASGLPELRGAGGHI
jgi:hypothetical protein